MLRRQSGYLTKDRSSDQRSYAPEYLRFSRHYPRESDSGAALVTDPDRCPAGLLFAGNKSGTSVIANPIAYVLIALSLEVDPTGETIL